MFYISYTYKITDGKYKTYNIYNNDWTYAIGIKYMRQIENEEVAKDLEKRKLSYHQATATFKNVLDLYLRDYEDVLKKSTAYNHRIICEKYFKTFMDSNKEFSDAVVQSNILTWLDTLTDIDISVVRKNRIKSEMKSLLQFAYERDYISADQLKKSSIVIKKANANQEVKEKLNFWTDEEFDKFISTFKEDDKWRFLFLTCYWGALRVGELLGLKWGDLDAKNKTISINKELTASGDIESTKNTSSNAPVSLPTELVKELVKFREDCKAVDDDFMFFINKTSRTTMRRVMEDHIEKANVKHITIHGLRHSMASYMINKGVDIMIISRHLRHSSTQQTYDTYCHLFPNRNLGVMDKIFR